MPVRIYKHGSPKRSVNPGDSGWIDCSSFAGTSIVIRIQEAEDTCGHDY